MEQDETSNFIFSLQCQDILEDRFLCLSKQLSDRARHTVASSTCQLSAPRTVLFTIRVKFVNLAPMNPSGYYLKAVYERKIVNPFSCCSIERMKY